MGAKSGKNMEKILEKEDIKIKKSKTLPIITEKSDKENLIWLDYNVGNEENSFYLNELSTSDKFKNICTFQKTKECIKKLKTIQFEKTKIIISGALSKEFFMQFENEIDKMKICPKIIIFTSKKKVNLIKENIISLDKFFI